MQERVSRVHLTQAAERTQTRKRRNMQPKPRFRIWIIHTQDISQKKKKNAFLKPNTLASNQRYVKNKTLTNIKLK